MDTITWSPLFTIIWDLVGRTSHWEVRILSVVKVFKTTIELKLWKKKINYINSYGIMSSVVNIMRLVEFLILLQDISKNVESRLVTLYLGHLNKMGL